MYKILICTSIAFSAIYLINIIRFIFGLTQKDNIVKNNKSLPTSIIIAVKNGESSISRMLDNLLKQSYSGDMEFIIVDDESNDNTKEIINRYMIKDPRFKYVSSIHGESFLRHKKKALDAGIKCAQHEHLLFTDIDCIIHSKWVKSMSECFSDNIDYIVGHTYILDRKSILNKFQRVDLFMLLFAARSSISLDAPWASTGQNQGYTKTLYNKLNGFKSISSYLQGDDTLFLQLAVNKGANIIFNHQLDSYVISRTELNWKNLLYQRARWSGDANIMWKFNLFFYLTALSLWVMSISIIGFLFTGFINIIFFILLLKVVLELTLYRLGMITFGHSIKYIDFIIWFIIHPFYVLLMGVLSFINFKWKGKSIK